MPINRQRLEQLASLIRYFCLVSTSKAGSGHPTSSLSAADLMAVLMFDGFFKFALQNPQLPYNDRLIFSKGHASPLFYALWAASGAIGQDELMTLRQFGSRLEGHPTLAFPYTEAATGSLGQGLSIGVGMAINAKYLDHLPYYTYVLLGDSEMTEGSVWEALALASHYKLNNLIGILDVNRLGQRGETMYGHNVQVYKERVASFGWETIVIDGHSIEEIYEAYTKALRVKEKPTMIIARTIKGKGVSFLEDKDGWHGRALKEEDLKKALLELGEVDTAIRGEILKLDNSKIPNSKSQIPNNIQIPNSKSQTHYPKDVPVSTRKAYGNALVRIFPKFPNMIVLDAEVSNSTYAEIFKKAYPERFFEMYVAEQNMAGVALGLSRRRKIPFVSSFAAFLTRAADQIRMSGYSEANIKFVGSHAGVSIGEDGASQMGLEDLSLFRTLIDSVVLYPADAIATEKLVEAAAEHKGIVYIRTTRGETPIIYEPDDMFNIGGSRVLKSSIQDRLTVITAGITLHEALAAYHTLVQEDIYIRIIDCYSIKPIDAATLKNAAKETNLIITVEDHYKEGGLGEAVASALAQTGVPIYIMACDKMPRSGKTQDLLDYEGISRKAIVEKVKKILNIEY